jgi:hypothetical protein
MAADPVPEDLARQARLPRNLVLAERPGAPAEDLRDCASVLMKSGAVEAARRLFDVAAFVGGSPENAGGSPLGETTWDIAVGELSALLSVADDGASGSVPETAASVGLVQDAFRATPIDVANLPPEPSVLAMAVAFNVMRRVLIRRADLALPPYGGGALFQSSQRLGAFGLGVGFQNIGVLAPTWPELRSLIGEAWRQAPREADLAATLDRFTVLLSIGLPARTLRTLVDELADAGRTAILQGILARLLREPADLADQDLLRSLRDAFLDLGNLTLGVSAQRHLTEVSGGRPSEQAAQGELEASLGQEVSIDPERKIMRRCGFASTAAQRARRFASVARA